MHDPALHQLLQQLLADYQRLAPRAQPPSDHALQHRRLVDADERPAPSPMSDGLAAQYRRVQTGR